MLEFSRVVDQCGSPGERITVLQKILAQAELLRHQGAVVATWRTQRGRTSGPFYRLAYRQGGRQRSIYLGRSALLARKVRALLAFLQRPMREERDWERLRRAVKSALRARKAEWARELAKHGFCLKGYEVRRWHDGEKPSCAAGLMEPPGAGYNHNEADPLESVPGGERAAVRRNKGSTGSSSLLRPGVTNFARLRGQISL